ncbi:hypothetical protein Hanom_Chr11g00986031 [Helianthus anomalus]
MEIERRELPSSDEFQRWPPMVSSSDVLVVGRWRNPLGGGCGRWVFGGWSVSVGSRRH